MIVCADGDVIHDVCIACGKRDLHGLCYECTPKWLREDRFREPRVARLRKNRAKALGNVRYT